MPVKSEGLRNGVLAATSGVTTLRWSMHQYITIEVDRDVLDHLGDPMSRSRQGDRGDQCKTTTQPMLVCAIRAGPEGVRLNVDGFQVASARSRVY